MSQSEWNAARQKLQSSPDYIMVRKSSQAGQFADEKKGGRDGIAVNWFEINKLDLPTGSGGGGPSYDDTEIKKDLADLQKEVDELQKQLDGIDTSDLATKKELTDAVKVLQDQIDAIQASGYDDTQIREDFADADELLQDQIDALEGFDPTPLEEKDAEQDGRLDQIDLDQEAQNNRLDQIDKDQKTQDDRLDALEAGEEGAVVGTWKRNDNASVSGGMIGVSNFNSVSSIMLNRSDLSYQPFDFSEIEVGTTLTITNTNNTDAKGKYKVTSMEDKGTYWRIGVDTIEGTGTVQSNNICEFSFAVAGAGAGEEGFDPTYLEEKDAEQDVRLDALEEDHTHDEYADAQTLADHIASHPSGGGDPYDDEWIQTALEDIDKEQEEQNDRLDALEAGGGGGGNGSLTYKSITNQAHILTTGVIFLAINGAQKQYIKVNKEDVNGSKTGTPVQGETLKIEAEGKENEFTIDYISEYDGYWMIIGDDDSIPDAIIITDLDKEVVLTFEQDEAAAGGFDPAYLEEKDAGQDDRLDALEKDIEEHSEEFEELKSQVDEHLSSHSGGNSDNVSEWTTKTDCKKADQGFVEFLIASGNRQSVLIPTLDADGNPSPVFEVGDIMTIKSDGHKNTFEVKSIAATAGGCVSYLSDYYGEGQFASTPDNEATIIKGEETADHEHGEFEEINERLDDLEKAVGAGNEKTSPKQTYITTTGAVNNSDGLVNLKVSLGDSSDQWVNFSFKDAKGENLVTPEVGDTFTVEYQDQVVYGEVNFCKGSDMWLTLPDGVDVIVSNSNGVEANLYIGSPREDEEVIQHDHFDYVDKAEFEELKEEVEGILNPTLPEYGDEYNFVTSDVLGYGDKGKCIISKYTAWNQQKVKVSEKNADGSTMPVLSVGDKMTIKVNGKKNDITIVKSQAAGSSREYFGDYDDPDILEQDPEEGGSPAVLIYGEAPPPPDHEHDNVPEHKHDNVPEHTHETPENVVTVDGGQDGLSIWRGTEAEYNAIADKQDNVLYITTA